MEGRTITRADLSESVFQEVGLSRNESSDLVETILAEVVDARISHRRDVNEHILAAVIRLDKPVSLVIVEKLNASCRHFRSGLRYVAIRF